MARNNEMLQAEAMIATSLACTLGNTSRFLRNRAAPHAVCGRCRVLTYFLHSRRNTHGDVGK